MGWLSGAWSWLRAVARRGTAEEEMDEELRFHLEMETKKKLGEGIDPLEAGRRANLAFGGVERHREELRDGRRIGWIEDLVADVRYAVRTLRRNPGFTFVAVLTIALGVGATTAVFSIANALLLRPLPVAEPSRLYTVDEQRSGSVATDMGYNALPYNRYQAYEEATRHLFSGLAATRSAAFSLRAEDVTVAVSGSHTSGNYFGVLGLRPTLGRFFDSDDDRAIVLSHRLWQEQLGGDPGVVGETMYLDSRPYMVVGVAPREFGGTVAGILSELWVPSRAHGSARGVWESRVVPFGRLRPGIEPAQAAAMIDAIGKGIPPDEPQTQVRRVLLDPMTGVPSVGRGATVGFLGMLLATAGLVLLIASANIAGMLLSRSVARRREVAVRLAIGARRGRLVRQFLTESSVLFLLGGGGGVLIAIWATSLLERVELRIFSQRIDVELSPDLRVLGFGLIVAAATGLLFGLAPALRSTRPDLVNALKDGEPAVGGRKSWGRDLFVAAQLALSVLLLVVAGLFVRTLQHSLALDPGFAPDGVVVARVNLTPHGYDEERGRAFYDQLVERARALPGVEDAALAQIVLLSGIQAGSDIESADTDGAGLVRTSSRHSRIDPAYFRTMRTHLVAGREFAESDTQGAPPVVIVNETTGRRLWPGESPLGRRLRTDGGEYEVVGVTRDGRYAYLNEDPVAFVFFPFEQRYASSMTLHVRTQAGPEETLRRLREEVRALDPNIALEDARPLPAVVGLSLLPYRFAATLVGLFGVVGLVLAGIGVYGVLAFQVAQRTRELGIRMALGARATNVLRLIVGRGTLVAAAGALVGLALAGGVTRFLRGFLFGVSELDVVTFVGAPLMLISVALVASYFPARRATRINPIEALRQD